MLASHADPDGDAVGSLLALGIAIGRRGQKTTIYNASPIPAVYRFLPSVERIVRHIKKAGIYDLALIMDCGDLPRIGEASTTVSQIPVVINIDHHISNTGFGDIQLIDPSACSTAELVYRLIKALDVTLDKAIATSLYTGILTDTGSFRFSSTNQAAFAISQEMAELGVEPHDVAQHVYGTYSLGRIKLLNLALDSIEISQNGKLSIMTVTGAMFAETGTHPEDVDGMINYARRIEDVKVAALIQEQQNGNTNSNGHCRYPVSLRSDGTVDATLTELKSDIITLAQNL